jgi:hypothetical protein
VAVISPLTADSSSLVSTPVPAATSSTRSGASAATLPASSIANGRNIAGASHCSYAWGIDPTQRRSSSTMAPP